MHNRVSVNQRRAVRNRRAGQVDPLGDDLAIHQAEPSDVAPRPSKVDFEPNSRQIPYIITIGIVRVTFPAASIAAPPDAMMTSTGRPTSSSARRGRAVKSSPCPATGHASGACPGYIKDHIVPLVCGGRDAVSSMQ